MNKSNTTLRRLFNYNFTRDESELHAGIELNVIYHKQYSKRSKL